MKESNYFDWFILLGILIFLVYTMIVIKKERGIFLKFPRLVDFNNYKLTVPRWWSPNTEKNGHVSFRRTDTRYDWKATFSTYPIEKSIDFKSFLIGYIEKKKIILDPETSTIEIEMNHTFGKYLPENTEMIRIEGTGTQDGTERVYYDICAFKSYKHSEYLICESESSVLNGGIEGPYFEEALKQIQMN